MNLKRNQISNKNDLQYEKHYANITHVGAVGDAPNRMAQESNRPVIHTRRYPFVWLSRLAVGMGIFCIFRFQFDMIFTGIVSMCTDSGRLSFLHLSSVHGVSSNGCFHINCNRFHPIFSCSDFI